MHTKQQSGFTLVELAVVVFLVGLLASVGLSALNAQMTSASISATKKKQEIIKDALIAYLGKNKRLPCPAKPDASGIIDGTESLRDSAPPYSCTGYFGILPYATLELTKSTALDGQENFFSYAVSQRWTLTYGTAVALPAITNIAGSAFFVGIPGTLTVNDRSSISPYPTTLISGNAAAVIVSHGKNGLGAFTSKGTQNVPPTSGTDERANAPDPTSWAAPPAFYQRGYTENPTSTFGAFDDVVQLLNPIDLRNPLIKDGTFKSPEAQWSEQVANIRTAITGYMFSPSNTATCAPPASSTFTPLTPFKTFEQVLTDNSIPLIDPWGGSINYTNSPNICRLKVDATLRVPSPITNPNCVSQGSSTITSVFVYTISSPSGGTVNGPTFDQLIAGYPNLLNNCP